MLFALLLLLLLGPFHWYVWKRTVQDTILHRGRRIAGLVVTALLSASLLVVLSRRVRDFLPDVVGDAVSKVGYVWLAALFYLLLILIILEVPRFFANRRVADESRRLLLARGAAVAAGLATASIVSYGMVSALGPPKLKRVQIPLAKLPRRLDGYRIAVVSDIHLGPFSSAAWTNRIVDAVNGMDADLVAVVGDLVDGGVAELWDQALPLRGLFSRDGAFFVTGNHEYYGQGPQWLERIDDLGMRLLRNERVTIRGIELAGVDDPNGSPDFRAALDGRDPANPTVLLAHQPVAVFEAARYKVDLQLSGHTHGGQMFPFGYVVRTQQPVLSGLAEIDGTKLYVTNGAGFWGPPVRVGAPPDITLVELRSA